MARKKFSRKLLFWYAENRRNLPWRHTKDPYKIWLSEIILQQTRVAQGIPYYQRFIRQFPTVFSLAKASEQDVLRLWQGLGYYTRARNLHHCALEVVENFHGKFPDNFKDLKKLRGIGSYTAAAIASISFHQPVVVVDGNVFRVLARIFGITKDISELKTKDYFFALGNELISKEHPDEFNQAIMEFGATHCLPKIPLCGECIFNKDCIANTHDLQTVLPVKKKKQKVTKRYFYYVIIRKGKKVAMRKRNEKDIWHGLFDFYLAETTKPSNLQKLREENKILKNVQSDALSKTYKHQLSHQQLLAKFITVDLSTLPAEMLKVGFKFYSISEIKKLPKPVLILRYLKDEGILE
ncbi:MAG: A/G-specific adenine glycosylase [Bacteroidia bacterium]|nr:A/G-specific adenine glycosylase [Bacteroidia bacterium]